jgi:hypothetical protein
MKRYDDYKLTKSGNKSRSKRDLTPEEFKKVEWLRYKIIVPTEKDKQELMEVFEHFHWSDIDTDYVGVNQLAHEYLESNSIIVDKELYDKLNAP